VLRAKGLEKGARPLVRGEEALGRGSRRACGAGPAIVGESGPRGWL
jgi:hypothetical protein